MSSLRTATNLYHASIIKAKRAYNSSLISSSVTNPRYLWKKINTIRHRSSLPGLPTYDSFSSSSHSFPKLFSGKNHKLHTSLLFNHTSTTPYTSPPFTPLFVSLPSHLLLIAIDNVSSLLFKSPDTSCDLDPIPTSFLK